MIGGVTAISKLLYRVLSLVVAIPISRIIKKLVLKAWAAARPNDPPRDPKKADVGWLDAIIWAVISGVGTALAKLISTKGAAGTWRAMIGTEPPAHESDPEKQKIT